MATPVINNITTNTVDDQGKQLIGNDFVSSVFYYDATTPAEVWQRDYQAVANPFSNGDFSNTTVTGTGMWQDNSTDASDQVRYIQASRMPVMYTEDLIAKYGTVVSNSTTSAGDVNVLMGDYFLEDPRNKTAPRNVFPDNYGDGMYSDQNQWWTTSSGNTEEGFVTFDLQSARSVGGFFIDYAHLPGADDTTKLVSSYQIKVSASGTLDTDFSVAASGTVDKDWIEPLYIAVPTTQARHIKVSFNNHGGSETTLMKVMAFSPQTIASGIGVMVKGVETKDGGVSETFKLSQDISLTNINTVYFDVDDYIKTANTDYLTVNIGGIKRGELVDYNIPGGPIVDYKSIKGLSIDTSDITGVDTFELSKVIRQSSSSSNRCFLLVSNFTTAPDWFNEPESATRGRASKFPEKSYIIVDAMGLSIIDAATTSLWMRFQLGRAKMLQQLPRSVYMHNGVMYLATSRGLFVIDFVKNKCVRFDDRGVSERFGIRYRNVDGIDNKERDQTPYRDVHPYLRVSDQATSKLPSLSLTSVTAGVDPVVGVFTFVGSSKGSCLILGNRVYTSACQHPVTKVVVDDENTIWYTSSIGGSAVVQGLREIQEAARDNFNPQEYLYQDAGYSADMGNVNQSSDWKEVLSDPAMTTSSTEGVYTISGTHTNAGPTGIIYKKKPLGRSFTASLDVRIIDFPTDARGSFRFGIAQEYDLDTFQGLTTSNEDNSLKKGMYMSAMNVDPFRGTRPGPTTFLDTENIDYLGWHPQADVVDFFDTTSNDIIPTGSGIAFSSVKEVASNSNRVLLRNFTTSTFERQPFTMSVDVKVDAGMVPVGTGGSNPTVFFGPSERIEIVPTSSGTSEHFGPGMLLYGNTTQSGTHFYTTGIYNSSNVVSAVFEGGLPPIGSTENSAVAPFREWKLDYSHRDNSVKVYLDGAFIRQDVTSSSQMDSAFIGVGFGVSRRGTSSTNLNRKATFKNFSIVYPTLSGVSQHKYGMEVERRARKEIVFSHYSGYQGYSLVNNTTPSTGVLQSNSTLSDGILHSGGITIAADVSIGIDLQSSEVIEYLEIYDGDPSTSLWESNSTNKEVEVWVSQDNISWTLKEVINVTACDRYQGAVRVNLSPSITTRFIQVRATQLQSNYNTSTGTSWTVAEMRAFSASALDFGPNDSTPSSTFKQWKLKYDSNSGLLQSYVGGVLTSSAIYHNFPKNANFVIMHDLVPVASGTNTYFHAETKNFQVSFPDTPKIPMGEVSSIATTLNPSTATSGQTLGVFTTASGGLGVYEKEVPVTINSFTDNISQWSVLDYVGATASGVWAVDNKSLVQTSTSTGKAGSLTGDGPYGTALIYDVDGDPLSSRTSNLHVSIYPVETGSTGVIWNFTDSSNFYYFSTSKEFSTIRVGKVTSGLDTVIATTQGYLQSHHWHTITIVNDSTSAFSVEAGNSQLLPPTTDNTHTTGKVGVFSNNSPGSRYSNVGIIEGSHLPESMRVFPPSVLFGGGEHVSSATPDDGASRAKGLVVVGTSSYTFSKFANEMSRPYWRGASPEDTTYDFKYGNRTTLFYHPTAARYYVLADKFSPVLFEIDPKERVFRSISMDKWRDTLGVSFSDYTYTGSLASTYISSSSEVLLMGPPQRLLYYNPQVLSPRLGPAISICQDEASNCSAAYILHDQTVFLSGTRVNRLDIASNTLKDHPQHFTANSEAWIRTDNNGTTTAPYFLLETDGGHSAVYCDYDGMVYILGGNSSGTSFYAYDPRTDVLTQLQPPPITSNKTNAQRLVFDPHNVRIYAVTERYIVSQISYYDVVDGNWNGLFEDAPFTARREWPETIIPDPQADGVTNFVAYNSESRSIGIIGRGRDSGFYEYYLPQQGGINKFEYIPAQHGLPNSPGLHKLDTEGSQRSSVEPSTFTTSIFRSDSSGTTTSPQKIEESSSEYVTISGGGQVNTGSTAFSAAYVNRNLRSSIGSFSVELEVALPIFTEEITAQGTGNYAHSYFSVGISDGVNRHWVSSTPGHDFGAEDPNLFQVVEVRTGVSGTLNDPATHGPLTSFLSYSDGQSTQGLPATLQATTRESFSSYSTGSVIPSQFSSFKKIKIDYTYESDTVTGYLDGVSVGTTVLKRKFNPGGIRFHTGWQISSDNDDVNNHFWQANFKNLKITPRASDKIESGFLSTTISGSIGSYYHQRWDKTVTSGVSWVVEESLYLPTNIKYSGFDYIASLAGVGDGHKLFELAAVISGSSKKIAVTGDRQGRHSLSTYLASTNRLWDDLELSTYKIVRDIAKDNIEVFLDGSTSPAISVSYDSLPSYNKQHVYYGKVNYGDWEKVIDTFTTVSGTWDTSPPGNDGQVVGKLSYSSNARFANISQGTGAVAQFDLPSTTGSVSVYAFYFAKGKDVAIDTPYTVYADSLDTVPSSGLGQPVLAIVTGVDENSLTNPSTTTLKIDQRRLSDGTGTSAEDNGGVASGWVYLGDYTNPSKVVITANANSHIAPQGASVCADAIGIDIGKYGKSEVEIKLKSLKYNTGTTKLITPATPGISIIDLGTNTRIDQFGEQTAPGLFNSDITSSDTVE